LSVSQTIDSTTFDTALARLFRASRYAERVLTRNPRHVEWLREHALRAATVTVADMGLLPAGDAAGDSATLDQLLRVRRQQAMLAILFRDINGLADLNEVMTAISAFADLTVLAARAHHTAALEREFDLAPSAASDLIVVGMGKLGAIELNVSSDIDLIFVHQQDGEAVADKSWHEFHSRLGRRMIRSLDHINENGQVFRVDMRLRPFGDSGPLVTSLAALERYFVQHARPWERYAWLKARAVTGNADNVAALDRLVQPFVYRRYHDYAAIEEMRALHAQIRGDANKRGKQNDIKVGEGGIREIEFVAQIHQLIRGGRDGLAGQAVSHSGLRTRSTRKALSELGARGILSVERVTALQTAYAFLRNLEHRLQYLDDQQTQSLPVNEADQARIAEAMGFDDWLIFMRALDAHRTVVIAEFGAVFGAGFGNLAATPVSLPGASSGLQSVDQTPASAGIPKQNAVENRFNAGLYLPDQQPQINERVVRWLASGRMQTLSPKLRARLETLIERALVVCATEDATTTTLFRVFALLEAIDKRETYLAFLVEYPEALKRVARIARHSAWAAMLLQRHPILLDDLSTPATTAGSQPLIDWPIERRNLEQLCDACHGDVERQYELLRHAKQRITLKLNIADIEGRVSVMALSDELSLLADMLVNAALTLAWRALNTDRVAGGGDWQAPPGFAVIGYGKWGSKELGYASDLDLVFLYDPGVATRTDLVGRLAQRLNSWLNTMTAGGVLYDTDLRLRPDGASGLLVSSLAAFRDYQRNRAWTWEHQALTRARWCAGDRNLAAQFDTIRADVLSKQRDTATLKQEIIDMRTKMRAEKKDKTDGLDLKNTAGGIIDIEFIVQYLILAYSHEHPEFLNNLGNFALLTRAAALGIIGEDQAAMVGKAYLAYRNRLHIAQNNNERKAWITADELVSERAAVVTLWKSMFGSASSTPNQ